MSDEAIRAAFRASLLLPGELEWIEFKTNKAVPQEIGEYISALANAAALHGQQFGYLIWGVEDGTRRVVGTSFRPKATKVGNEELEPWLLRLLEPRIDFVIHEFDHDRLHVVVFQIPRAVSMPIRFGSREFVRCGSCKKPLRDYPEKERKLWQLFSAEPFECCIAEEMSDVERVLAALDYQVFFELTRQKVPFSQDGVVEKLVHAGVLVQRPGCPVGISNLGAVLLAKRLSEFRTVRRKALRVVVYAGTDRTVTVKEQPGSRGYAAGYERVISYIMDQLPQMEEIRKALRTTKLPYPEIAVRELVANALIHQDFTMTGAGPMVEIFSDRMEITNPGVPLVDTMRFIDVAPRSRNENIAALMRLMSICEERGSGIDKVIYSVEVAALPAPEFTTSADNTKAVLFGPKALCEMTHEDRIRACYQHACLMHVSGKIMSNATLRKRLSIEPRNAAMASRIIAESVRAELIRKADAFSESKKHAKYLPFWA